MILLQKDIDKFNRKHMPVTETGCWLWLGYVCPKGYGRMGIYGQGMQRVHRVAYELFKGPIPIGLTIDHLCRVHCCVNPDHLEAVTSRENTLRSNNPAMKNARATHCINGHEWTPENIIIQGGRWRWCRACGNERGRAYRARKREAAN